MDTQNNTTETEIKEPKKDSGLGAVIGSIIIVVIIILGGLYYWGHITDNKINNYLNEKVEVPKEENKIDSQEIKDSKVAEINNELNNTDVKEIDTDLNQINQEIDQATK